MRLHQNSIVGIGRYNYMKSIHLLRMASETTTSLKCKCQERVQVGMKQIAEKVKLKEMMAIFLHRLQLQAPVELVAVQID